MVREIQENTGTTISIEDDGTIQIAATNLEQRDTAIQDQRYYRRTGIRGSI